MTLRKWWMKTNISRSFDTTMDSRSSWTWAFPSSSCPTRPWCPCSWRVWTGMSSSLRSSTSRKRLTAPARDWTLREYAFRCVRGTLSTRDSSGRVRVVVASSCLWSQMILIASAVRDGRHERRRRWKRNNSAVRLSVTPTETFTRRRARQRGCRRDSELSLLCRTSPTKVQRRTRLPWTTSDYRSIRRVYEADTGQVSRSLVSSYSRRRGFPLTRRPRKPRMSSSCPLRRTCPRRLAVSHRSSWTRPNPCRSSRTCYFRWTSTQTRRVRAKGDALSAVSLKTKCHYNCNSNCCLLLILRISLLPQRLLLLRLLLLLLL